MSVTPNLQKPNRDASDWRTQVSLSNDHTLKSRVKGNFHARLGIGGGESDLPADHTKKREKKAKQLEKGIEEQGRQVRKPPPLLKRK